MYFPFILVSIDGGKGCLLDYLQGCITSQAEIQMLLYIMRVGVVSVSRDDDGARGDDARNTIDL